MRTALLLFLVSLSAPWARGVIINGTSSFDFTEGSGPGSSVNPASRGLVNLIHNSQDQAFQIWWYIRGPGDTAEIAFPTASESEVGNANTLTWASLSTATGPLGASSVFTLTNSGSVTNLAIDFTLNYTGSGPAVFDVFLYADLDLNGTAGGDSAAGGLSGVTVTEGGSAFLVSLTGANTFQVSSFASLRSLLTDSSVTNLNNSGLPFGPGDFTVAFQKALTFSNSGSQLVSANIGVGATESLLIPEPSAISLTAAGLLALVLTRRRIRR